VVEAEPFVDAEELVNLPESTVSKPKPKAKGRKKKAKEPGVELQDEPALELPIETVEELLSSRRSTRASLHSLKSPAKTLQSRLKSPEQVSELKSAIQSPAHSPAKSPQKSSEKSAQQTEEAVPKKSLGDPWDFKDNSNRNSMAETETNARRKTNARKTFVLKPQGPLIADPARRKTTAPAPPREKENDPMDAVESIIHEVRQISKSPLVLQPYMAPMGETGTRELTTDELDMTLEDFTRMLIEEEKKRLQTEGERMLTSWMQKVAKVRQVVRK
jgi:hypothetical protein